MTYSDEEMEKNKKLEQAEWELTEEPIEESDIPDEERFLKDWGKEEHDKFKKPRDDKMKKEDIEFAKGMTGEVTFEEFKAFEGSMSDVEPPEIELTKEREDFIKRRKIEKTAAKKANIDEGIEKLK